MRAGAVAGTPFPEKGAKKVLNRRKATRFSQKRGKTGPQAGQAANGAVQDCRACEAYPATACWRIRSKAHFPVETETLKLRIRDTRVGMRRRPMRPSESNGNAETFHSNRASRPSPRTTKSRDAPSLTTVIS